MSWYPKTLIAPAPSFSRAFLSPLNAGRTERQIIVNVGDKFSSSQTPEFEFLKNGSGVDVIDKQNCLQIWELCE